MATVTVTSVPQARIDDEQISRWIGNRLNDARNRFLRHMARGGGGGRTYWHGKRVFHVASQGLEFPLNDSGRLSGSAAGRKGEPPGRIATTIDTPHQGSIWSDVNYAGILEAGSEHMAPRLMLADALTEVLEARPETDELARAAKIV